MFNESGDIKYPCLDLIFSGTVSIVLPANVIFTVGFDRYPLSD